MEIARAGTTGKMSGENGLIRRASAADAGQISTLLRRAQFQHQNADWNLPGDWLEAGGFLLVEEPGAGGDKRPVACLAVASDVPTVAWVRLAAFLNKAHIRNYLPGLLAASFDHLWDTGVELLCWMEINPLPGQDLAAFGFRRLNWITTYLYDDMVSSSFESPTVSLRPATQDDVPEIYSIDTAAFIPLWRHSEQALAAAFGESLSFIVAESEDRMVGFAYTVAGVYQNSAHLVRITIRPECQGQGIGSALMAAVINDSLQIGIKRLTLNTQIDNIASRRLYEKFGFRSMGDQLPIWGYQIT